MAQVCCCIFLLLFAALLFSYRVTSLNFLFNELDGSNFEQAAPHHVQCCNIRYFFDYRQLLDVFYKNFPSGSIQDNHVFLGGSSTPNHSLH